MAFLDWMKERSAPKHNAARRPELSWQKAQKQGQYKPVSSVSESEKAQAREIGERLTRASRHLNAGGHGQQWLADEPGGSGSQRLNQLSQDRQAAPLIPSDGNAGKTALEAVHRPLEKTPKNPSPAQAQQPSPQSGLVRLGALSGVLEMRHQTGSRLVAQAVNGGCLRCVDRAIGPAGQAIEAVELPPGARDEGKSILWGHALAARQEDALGFSRWPDCHKTVTLKDAACVVQGKGRKALYFASNNPALRPSQGRPKLCLGETYADLILPILG
jgi:hypothetical protein